MCSILNCFLLICRVHPKHAITLDFRTPWFKIKSKTMDSDACTARLMNLLTSKYGPEAGDTLSGQHPCLVNEQQPTDIFYGDSQFVLKNPVLRIRNVYPGSWIPDPNFCHPGSEFFPPRIPDLHQRIHSILTPPKMVSKLSGIWSWLFIPDPDPDFLPIPDPGSRGQKGIGSRSPGWDPQHWKINYEVCLRLSWKFPIPT